MEDYSSIYSHNENTIIPASSMSVAISTSYNKK